MSLKKKLKDELDIDLPISGGMGKSKVDPIIIEEIGRNNYVRYQYQVIDSLGKSEGFSWKVVRQELLNTNKRYLDRMIVEIQWDDHSDKEVREYYFDISNYF